MTAESLRQKYARLAETEPGVSAVGWLDSLQQAAQFEVMLSVGVTDEDSVLDVGCGWGDLLAALDDGGFKGRYTGVDLIPQFTAQAQTRFAGRDGAQFVTGDIAKLDLPPHDFVFLSGLFDYQAEDSVAGSVAEWESLLTRIHRLAGRALVWNGYYRLPLNRADMWAVDLADVTALCQRLSSFWRLRADYAPGHYTAFVLNEAYWLTPSLQRLIGHLFLDAGLGQVIRQEPQSVANRYGVSLAQLNLIDPLLQM